MTLVPPMIILERWLVAFIVRQLIRLICGLYIQQATSGLWLACKVAHSHNYNHLILYYLTLSSLICELSPFRFLRRHMFIIFLFSVVLSTYIKFWSKILSICNRLLHCSLWYIRLPNLVCFILLNMGLETISLINFNLIEFNYFSFLFAKE